jgi:hypothetical protein
MLVMFKGTVSLIENWLKVVPWDRPCLTHQALAILEIINSPFWFLQAFKFLCTNAKSIWICCLYHECGKQRTKRILNLTFHIPSNFYPCSLLVGFNSHFSLFPTCRHFLFPLGIWDSKCTNISHSNHIMKAARWLHALCVFMMQRANMRSTICIMKEPSSLLFAFKKKIVGVCYHCGGWSEEVNSCILIISYMVYL